MANGLSRILYFTYPTLIFTVAFLAMASSNQAQVTGLNLPPLGGESFYWNPSLTEQSCKHKSKSSFGSSNVCKSNGSLNPITLYSNKAN